MWPNKAGLKIVFVYLSLFYIVTFKNGVTEGCTYIQHIQQ